MKTVIPQTPGDSSEEIAALIEVLHTTGQRLEQLTGGEVDSVTSPTGRTFLLQHAQDQSRVSEATKQAAILNALPANIALLNAQGIIVSVNKAWRRFGDANAAHDPEHEVGTNYLTVCDRARGVDSAEARQAGDGIRKVLAGETQRFTLEYPCHSATQQRCFMMTVTPLSEDHSNGVVVMHSDVSEHKRTEAEKAKFLDVLEASLNEIYIFDANTLRFDFVNDGARRNLGYTMDEMRYQTPLDFKPEFTEAEFRKLIEPLLRHEKPKIVFQTVHRRADGSQYPVEVHLQFVERAGKGVFLAVINDITERKQAERALRTNEQRYRILFESMDEAYCVVEMINDADGKAIDYRFVEINPAFERHTGLHQAVGKTARQLVPENEAHWFDIYGKVARTGEAIRFESPADAMHRFFDVYAFRIGGDGSKNVGILFRNITERINSEIALRESELRYHSLFSNMLEGYAYCETIFEQGRLSDFIYLEVNAAFGRLTGLNDVAGKKVSDVIPSVQKDNPDLFQIYERVALTGRPEKFEMHIPALGTWLSITVYSPDKRHFVAVFENITERRNSEARILYLSRVHAMMSGINTLIVRVQDSEELFKEACKVAVETGGFRMAMIVIVDRGAKKIFPAASAGKHEALIGIIKSTLSSEHASTTMVARAINEKKIIVSNDSQNDSQVLFGEKYAESGVHSIVILPLIVADEAVGALALYATETNFFHEDELKLLTDLVGDISYAMGYLKAVEALRRLNEELEDKVVARTADLEQARHVADQANQTKSAFLATMSHEIRTPMNGVIGMIDVLHQTSLKGHQLEMVDLISESAFSLLDIIEDILDLSKIESGKLEIERVPMSLVEVMEKACGLLDHSAVRKGVELTLFIDPAIPEEVLGDALRLRQVLVNLANNAIKFSSGLDHPGHVSVRALLAERGPNQVAVEFQVTDNGIGMDKDTLARLFTPFTQADTTTTRRFGGTGLGLAISRHLVERMDGEIRVQSALDNGATFTVRLPFTPLPDLPIRGGKFANLSGLSCLVLGDQGLADDLAVYLSHGGALVERAQNLDAAIKLIGTVPPGLWLFIIDARDDTPPVEALRAACNTRLNLDSRFVVVEHGHHQPGLEPRFVVIRRGRRRHGRIQAVDLVTLDGDVLHRQHFLQAVAIAAGRAQEDEEEDTPMPGKAGTISPPSREEALRQGHLILVAEDNETNRKVILHQLGLLGYRADVTGDGRKALERWESDDYALLLTDLHMPEMDGYQLTAAIRAGEAGNRHIPIVALTANALKGEAEHCRAAGMDDYLSKPARLADLKAMLKKWLPAAVDAGTDSLDTQATAAPQAVPVDVSVLVGLVGNDPVVIHELLQDFRGSAAKIAGEVQAACAAGQAAAAEEAAHKLKSSAYSVGALALGELCAAIEQAGKAGQVDALTALLPRFEAELVIVDEYLESL